MVAILLDYLKDLTRGVPSTVFSQRQGVIFGHLRIKIMASGPITSWK